MDITTLRTKVTGFCRERIKELDLPDWWREPLLATARADERFDILPKIAAPNHMLPRDLLLTCRSVVVFMVPFNAGLSGSNIGGKFPSPEWGLAMPRTNQLIQDIGGFIAELMDGQGYASGLTPATYNIDPDTLTADWSHKHLAHIAGLGRFGINAQLISPLGCAGRLGSLVTQAPLGDHPLVTDEELCLYKQGLECLKCMETCPMQAISLEGIDRRRCDGKIEVNRKRFARKFNLGDGLEVCAKCVSGMPCHLEAPQAQQE
jgi:epoxyqueuosine reductase QueG